MVILNTIIDKIETLKDNSIKIVLETQEIEGKEALELFSLRNKYIYTFLKETPFEKDELDIKEPMKEFKTDKTPSQRLRSVLYVYWNEKKPTSDFETFYKSKMSELTEYIKSKLN